MHQVKGSVLKSRLALVKQLAGEDGAAEVVGQLSEEHREILETVVSVGWYPFEVSVALDRAIVAVVGRGDPAFFEKLGEASAQQNLTGAHKSFLSPGDPQAFLRRTPQIYKAYYDSGTREYEPVSEHEAVLTTRDAESATEADCATVVGWYRRALEMCGARNPRVTEEECRARGGAVCRYRLVWD